MADWKTCFHCPCSTVCTENGALCQGWGSGPQKSPGPMGFGDQWHIDEIARLRADLAEAREALEPFAKLADAAGVQGCADDADWQIDLLGPRDGPAKGYRGDFTTADLRRTRAVMGRGA